MDHPVTLEEERKVWTIHQSVNGTTYYYNRATKKSQYEMPQCFKTTEEVLEHPDWKEYRTAQGKKFYYNATTRKSCWQLPNQVKEYRLKLEQKRRRDKEEGKLQQQQPLSQAEEIKRKFMHLLRQKLIGVNTKWDACIKLCEDDDRWQLLKISDKKKYFNEYISELKKISDQEKKAKTQVNRAQFIKMLRENKTLTSDCKMHKIAYDFIADPRWRLLEQHQRQNTFQTYMDELSQKEKQQSLRIKQLNCNSLRQLFETDQLKHNTKWDDVRIKFKNNDIFKALHNYDRITTFIDFVLDAEKKNQEELAKERRLRERVNRIAFRQMLRQKLLQGELAYKTKWKDFIIQFRSDIRLLNMMDPNQPSTSAHQMFEHFMEQVREKHKIIKGLIKHHFKKISFKMTEETSKQQFKERLENLAQYKQLKQYLQDYFHRYFQLKIKSKKESKIASAKKSSKKQRKIIFKIFRHLQLKDLLKNKYSIQSQMQYVEKSMKGLGYAITHEAIFKYYLAFLERNESQQKGRSRSSSSDSLRKAGKRKHKIEQIQDEEEFASSLRKFTIPQLTERRQEQMNEIEQQGEIKDDSQDSDKKKKNKSKKKKKSSSSDSD